MHMDKILANYNYCCLSLVTRRLLLVACYLLLRNVKSQNRRIVESLYKPRAEVKRSLSLSKCPA